MEKTRRRTSTRTSGDVRASSDRRRRQRRRTPAGTTPCPTKSTRPQYCTVTACRRNSAVRDREEASLSRSRSATFARHLRRTFRRRRLRPRSTRQRKKRSSSSSSRRRTKSEHRVAFPWNLSTRSAPLHSLVHRPRGVHRTHCYESARNNHVLACNFAKYSDSAINLS